MAIDINSLFQDILETPEQKREKMLAQGAAQGQLATSNLTGFASAASPLIQAIYQNMPQRNEAMRTAVGGLLGKDLRTTSDKVQEAMSRFNPLDPQSVVSTTNMLRQMGMGTQAAQLAAMAAEEQKNSQMQSMQVESARLGLDQQKDAAAAKRASETLMLRNRPVLADIVSQGDITPAKKAALQSAVSTGAYDGRADDLIAAVFPDGDERYKAVGGAIFDSKIGQFITAPNGGVNPSDLMSSIDPDQYDSASISDFIKAQSLARTPDEMANAYRVLKPKADEGFVWDVGYDEQNNPINVQRPIPGSAPYTETMREVSAANNAGQKAMSASVNAVGVADRLIDALENNKVDTGVTGIVLSFVPGTNEANLAADIDTLLANLGISSLQEMRAASANGASGFGQLTERELSRLEAQVRNLTRTQDRAQLVDNLKVVRSEFERVANKAKTNWTLDEWRGIAKRPEPEGSVTTSSGSTFTVKPL